MQTGRVRDRRGPRQESIVMSEPFRGIDHLGVAVRDLEAAIATYRDILGFEITGRDHVEERGLDVAFVNTGSGRIELIAPSREGSEVSGFLDKRGEGLHHLCVAVEDLDGTLARLVARGARMIDTKAKVGAHGTRVAFVHPKGAAGVLLELVEQQAQAHG
jgi:methylmalonyl-CoA/ethylmalonyl-CoA epimerase